MITAQIDNLFAHKVGLAGIQPDTEQQFQHRRTEVAESISNSIRNSEFGFVNILNHLEVVSAIRHYLHDNPWIKTLVVVGIGGSDLGARAIRQALARETKSQKPQIDVLFHGDSTDPNDIAWILDRIEFESTAFNIVSKSGGTMEIMAQYVFLKEIVKDHQQSWQKHFVLTTDAENGALRSEAEKHGIHSFEIPADVGGRYSVLSSVGLLPAMAMGLDAGKLIGGAKAEVREFLENPADSTAMLIAWSQFLLHQQGLNLAVLMPYSTRLNEFGRWYRQLWAESLGKVGTGILPIQARGPADQHSQLQYYVEGKLLGSVWFIRVEDHGRKYVIRNSDTKETEYLAGKDFADIINIEQQATAAALTKAQRPNATLVLDKLDESTLGEMFMTFELAVVCLAKLLDVNPFDQPGVEQSKKMMYALLGRPGFEDSLPDLGELST